MGCESVPKSGLDLLLRDRQLEYVASALLENGTWIKLDFDLMRQKMYGGVHMSQDDGDIRDLLDDCANPDIVLEWNSNQPGRAAFKYLRL
jgi:hypothetical protein